MRFPGFIGPSYTLRSVNVDCQRCVNLYPEINELGTGKEREVASLVSTPGLRLLLTLPASPTRGGFTASNGEVYAVGGNKLYSLSSSWVATELGSLNTSSGPVSLADNGTHLVLVDGTNGYVWNMSTDAFSTITDPDFLGADTVTFQDGYFIFTRDNITQQGQISGLNDVTFDALDVFSAEGSPDALKVAISMSQNVYMLGAQSIEVFYNSGDADSPFQRIQGAVIPVGCKAAHSARILAGSIYWLGSDKDGYGIVYRTEGYQAKRVSTPSVESVIQRLTSDDLEDATAWTYQDGGHLFYCLNLPGAEATWVFDASSNLWHERCYRDLWELERHRAEWHAVAFGTHIVGDYENGNIYALSSDVYTDEVTDDAPTAIVRMRRAPHVSKDLLRLFHKSFQLDMEMGVGLDGSGQGVDPLVILRFSDDGGHTWSSEREASMGKIGEYKKPAFWRRLGSSRDRVYEVSTSEPVKVVIIGAELDVEEGSA